MLNNEKSSGPGLRATSGLVLCCGLVMMAANHSEPTPQAPATTRSVVIEVYHDGDSKELQEVTAILESLKTQRGGITIVRRDTGKPDDPQSAANAERSRAIARHYKLPEASGVMIYGCNRAIVRQENRFEWKGEIQRLLRLEVFVRTGCSRCASAKTWIRESLAKEYPGMEVTFRDLATDSTSLSDLNRLVARHKTAAASVPVFHFCDGIIVGFDESGATRDRIRSRLKKWSHERPASESEPASDKSESAESKENTARFPSRESLSGVQLQLAMISSPFAAASTRSQELEIPEEPVGLELPEEGDAELEADPVVEDEIEVPLFGRLSAAQLGMPVFTVVIGLVDGFNPCAMWVLLFLLSILVNLKDRTRILAIAGTFVVVSGVAYFCFMAAWLNVFLLIGYLRPIQIALGLLAIVMGGVHVKDFFALHRGVSFSIPESAKPGIYDRVRKIVTAESLKAAVAGAVVLAILVNLIELLCTAGLPALYTNILTQQGYSSGVRYLYLGLYILAYMFDDALMVGAVVVTLSRRRLQETHGRWLKLLSGSAILLLGIIMLIRPEWLH